MNNVDLLIYMFPSSLFQKKQIIESIKTSS